MRRNKEIIKGKDDAAIEVNGDGYTRILVSYPVWVFHNHRDFFGSCSFALEVQDHQTSHGTAGDET